MRGFTLLELVIAVSIAAILSGIAMPAYRELSRRALRHEAQLALTRLQYLQERHYAIHHRYAAGIGEQSTASVLRASARSEAGTYDLEVLSTSSDQEYMAIASPATGSPQAQDRECSRFSVDQTGLRRSADTAGHWSEGSASRCWR